MSKTVVALFDDRSDAHKALSKLVDAGIDRKNISLIASDADGEYKRYVDTDDDANEAAEGAADGAKAGGIIGGIGGLLLGLGVFAVPGLGALAVAGPIASTLVGAGAGAATGGLIGALVGAGVPDDDAEFYAEGVRRGGTLVMVDATDANVDRVVDVLNASNPIDLEDRSAYWRENGWTGYDADTAAYTADEVDTERTSYAAYTPRTETIATEGEEVLEVVEEELKVGKREVQTGGVRVHKHVGERPVEEDVTLREEHVTVERRAVNRPATEADFTTGDRVVEMVETAEEVVTAKEARVVEEVVVGKEAMQHTETVRDTVRFTEIDIEHLDSDYTTFRDDFTTHYQATYSGKGDFDSYEPAYRYGYALASNEAYAERDWDDAFEASIRRDWDERYGDTYGPFDRMGDAIKEGWYKTKSAVDAMV
ncbi:MAG: hypothetical protein RhofKO_21810 [Rhodothermales bacterium]